MNDKKVILEKVYKLQKLFNDGQIPTLEIHEIYPNLEQGSRENLLYFTLVTCLNFQRSSSALWQSTHSSFADRETNYLFDPANIVRRERSEIQADMAKHCLALQPNKHTDIWINISTTLHHFYQSDPRRLFEQCGWDVVEILRPGGAPPNTLELEPQQLPPRSLNIVWITVCHPCGGRDPNSTRRLW